MKQDMKFINSYSTDDLVKELMRHWVGIGDCFNKRDAIIDRLRAGDKLCARDKKMVIKVTEGTGITLGEMAEWAKSIADYGGKEK